MILMLEFLPILIFFAVFKWQNLICASIAAMIANLLLLILVKINTGKYKKMSLISFLSLFLLSSFALIFKKEIFIKWKPTAIYWILALTLFIRHVLGKSSLIEKLNKDKIRLPKKVWDKLNILWMMFFIFMGSLNLYVVYFYDTNTWVNFKLFGTFAITILFVLFQLVFISKYLADSN